MTHRAHDPVLRPNPALLALIAPLALALAGCGRAQAQQTRGIESRTTDASSSMRSPSSTTTQPAPAPTPTPTAATTATPAASEPDGNDEHHDDTGTGALPTVSHFERVGRAPLAHVHICDLTVFRDALYSAHARAPLGSDGATITRYQPSTAGGRAFTVAFDWNRPGQPSAGGGAGQGFIRVRTTGDRLFVPDADSPYAGFGTVFAGTESYVFVSDRQGAFAPARGERLRPPDGPDAAGRAGAAVLPRAYHVIDVVQYRGRMFASTGSVPPGQRPWYGASPGALHVASADLRRWTYAVDYPFPWQSGVWRLTYMTRFRGRLYAGIQDYDGREPNDYVFFDPGAQGTLPTHAEMHPVRVTQRGGAQTLRWYAHGGRLYWVTLDRDGRGVLRVTDDGDTWREVAMPAEAGRVADVTFFRGSMVALTEGGLYRLDGETPVEIAHVEGPRSPFGVTDIFCAAPLAVYRNELYAGGQRDGALYRLVDGPVPAAAAPAPAPRRR